MSRRSRSSKDLRLVLLSLGLCGAVLAIVLATLGKAFDNGRLRELAFVYILCSVLFLGVRAVLIWLKRHRKRRRRTQRELARQTEVDSSS